MVVLDAKSKYIGRYRGFFPADYLKIELEKSKILKGKRFITPKNTTASL
jgi:thioredoxin 1